MLANPPPNVARTVGMNISPQKTADLSRFIANYRTASRTLQRIKQIFSRIRAVYMRLSLPSKIVNSNLPHSSTPIEINRAKYTRIGRMQDWL